MQCTVNINDVHCGQQLTRATCDLIDLRAGSPVPTFWPAAAGACIILNKSPAWQNPVKLARRVDTLFGVTVPS